MSTRKDKHIRKIVRNAVGDQSRAYLLALIEHSELHGKIITIPIIISGEDLRNRIDLLGRADGTE